MELRKLILGHIRKHSQLKTSDIVTKTGLSRAYVQRTIKELTDGGLIRLVGKANQAHYVPISLKGPGKDTVPLRVHRIVVNRDLSEDKVLREIMHSSACVNRVASNIVSIFEYAFTEMLNNAIEHSQSDKIDIVVLRTEKDIRFAIADKGIGIFNNIRKKMRLKNTLEAVQDLLKGKETTAPDAHSGEGIFFTSRIADRLTIKSFDKKLVFDNAMQDIFIRDVKPLKGTKVEFIIAIKSKKKLADLFGAYTDNSYQFSKTGVKVKLYHQDVEYVSRSQARRILVGLEKFKSIDLDFKDVETIGQAFADEIFRVWQGGHKNIEILINNANENVMFMIQRAQSQ